MNAENNPNRNNTQVDKRTQICDRMLKAQTETTDDQMLPVANELIASFCDHVFSGHVPPRLQRRLGLLRRRVIINDGTFKIHNKEKPAYESDRQLETTRGLYDINYDWCYLPSDTTFHILIHEMLHFVSSDFGEGNESPSSGIEKRSEHTFKKKYFPHNDAFDTLLTYIITGGIDTEDENLIDTMEYYIKQNGGVLNTAYTDYLENMLTFFKKRKWPKDYIDCLSRYYLTADHDGFMHALNTLDMSPGLIKVPASKEFFETVPVQGKILAGEIKSIFSSAQSKFDSDKRFSRKHKKLVKQFVGAVYDETNTEFYYDGSELAPARAERIDISFDKSIILTKKPRIIIFLSLFKSMTKRDILNKEFYEMKISPTVASAYLLWQGIKLNSARRKRAMFDSSIYTHPTMQDFLSRVSAEELFDIQSFFANIFNYTPVAMDPTSARKIMDSRLKSIGMTYDFIKINMDDELDRSILKNIQKKQHQLESESAWHNRITLIFFSSNSEIFILCPQGAFVE